MWLFRTDAICYGVIIAWIHHKKFTSLIEPKFLNSQTVRVFCSITMLLLIFMVAKVEIVWFYNGLVSLVAALLVFVASYGRGYFIKNEKVLNLLNYIGERSYSMYLIHMVCFTLVIEVALRFWPAVPTEGSWPIVFAIAAISAVVILSELSFRFIETPFRDKGRLLSVKKKNEIDSYINRNK
jgi:peptidoglycan/LPS O-acetylase OafA/YrhL